MPHISPACKRVPPACAHILHALHHPPHNGARHRHPAAVPQIKNDCAVGVYVAVNVQRYLPSCWWGPKYAPTGTCKGFLEYTPPPTVPPPASKCPTMYAATEGWWEIKSGITSFLVGGPTTNKDYLYTQNNGCVCVGCLQGPALQSASRVFVLFVHGVLLNRRSRPHAGSAAAGYAAAAACVAVRRC